jgi:hypothetical protein
VDHLNPFAWIGVVARAAADAYKTWEDSQKPQELDQRQVDQFERAKKAVHDAMQSRLDTLRRELSGNRFNLALDGDGLERLIHQNSPSLRYLKRGGRAVKDCDRAVTMLRRFENLPYLQDFTKGPQRDKAGAQRVWVSVKAAMDRVDGLTNYRLRQR